MNAEQLTAIKERAEKATHGPWNADIYTIYSEKDGHIAEVVDDNQFNNMHFIAHARQDIPALVAEVERLKDENSSLKRSLEYIAPRKSNPDWTIAHNALAVWGRAE